MDTIIPIDKKCHEIFGENLEESVAKLAILGEQAGFTLEQMIGLLNAGLSVSTLLELIAWRLEIFSCFTRRSQRSSRDRTTHRHRGVVRCGLVGMSMAG